MPFQASAQNLKPKWAVRFNVDDATWVTLCSQGAQNQTSPLENAFEMHLLNETQILEWDRDQSGIAALKETFFDQAPPLTLFQNYDYARCRAKGCMPVAEWNGNIYWAKLSSDLTGFENEAPQALWFLASWSGLKKWFSAWQSMIGMTPKAVAPPAPAMAEMPANEPQEIILDVTEIHNTFIHDGPAAEPVGESIAPMGTETATIIDSGLSVAMDFGSLTQLDSEGALAPASEFIPPTKSEEPALTDAASADALDLELDLGFGDGVTSVAPIESPAPMAPPPVANLEAMEINLNDSPSEDLTSIAPVETPVAVKPIVSPPPPPAPPAPTPLREAKAIQTIPLDQFESRLKHASSQDALAETLLGLWQNYFEQTMVLLFQGDRLIIWWHNNKWKSQIKRGEGIPIDTPSIFKIVADTGRPYHGYVATGTVNDEFFKVSNAGDYPEHVSIVPVLAGERVVAMLLGTCGRDAGKQLTLDKLENDGQIFATALIRLMTPKSQAS